MKMGIIGEYGMGFGVNWEAGKIHKSRAAVTGIAICLPDIFEVMGKGSLCRRGLEGRGRGFDMYLVYVDFEDTRMEGCSM